MAKVEEVVKGITKYADARLSEESLKVLSKKTSNGMLSVEELINDDITEFIDEAQLEKLFELDDKESQVKLLRKIMYIAYVTGLGEDSTTMALKALMKLMKDKI